MPARPRTTPPDTPSQPIFLEPPHPPLVRWIDFSACPRKPLLRHALLRLKQLPREIDEEDPMPQATRQRQPRPQPTTADKRPLLPSLKPLPADDFTRAEAQHLLSRAGFGGSPRQILTLTDWGLDRSIDELTAVDQDSWPTSQTFQSNLRLPLTAEEQQAYRRAQREQDEDTVARFRIRIQSQQRADREQVGDMQRWWLKRMIETPHPLEEKMTLFWHGHFATSYRTIENSYHLFMQNQMFRKNALGNFGDLLFGIIRDPAMLAYLNNDQNRRGSPNENLAREILELFSLGEGNYSETDIKEGARCLTGYTFEGNDFVFRADQHDTGAKLVLGKRGNLDGDDLVKQILSRRACADFLAWKLYEYFAAPIPTDKRHPHYTAIRGAVRALSAEILRARYNLKPALAALFKSDHFYHPAIVGEQIKSPVDLVVGAMRTMQTPARNLAILNDSLDLMGQRLFFPPNVAGWAGNRAWINTSTLFVRQNIMNFLLTGKTPTGYAALSEIERYDSMGFVQSAVGASRDPDRVARGLLRFMLPTDPRTDQVKTLTDFATGHAKEVNQPIATGMMALITTMPEYQLF